MDRAFTFEKDEYYHIYNRGIDKRNIFFSEGDWKHFQRLLYIRNDATGYIRPERVKDMKLSELNIDETLVDVCAYAMMPNHFHVLVRGKNSEGVSRYMSKLLTSYSMYMNKKYNRTGPLMCRPFRAKHVDADEYLQWLVSYIHLNPLDKHEPKWKEIGITDKDSSKNFLMNYTYSSYPDYYGEERDESCILSKNILMGDIHKLESIESMLQTSNNPHPNGLGES